MAKYAEQILDLVLCSAEHPTAEHIFWQMKQKKSMGKCLKLWEELTLNIKKSFTH